MDSWIAYPDVKRTKEACPVPRPDEGEESRLGGLQACVQEVHHSGDGRRGRWMCANDREDKSNFAQH